MSAIVLIAMHEDEARMRKIVEALGLTGLSRQYFLKLVEQAVIVHRCAPAFGGA